MRTVALSIAAALVVGGCASSLGQTPEPATSSPKRERKPPSAYQVVQLTDLEIKAVHAGVRKQLKDPDSARFGETFASRDAPSTTHVCGWVNAKNSYGGYTGEKVYIGLLLPPDAKRNAWTFLPLTVGGTRDEQIVARQVCASYNINIR